MKRILVIGIGSLLMTDDGIGSRVVKAIANSLRERNISYFIGETDFLCSFLVIRPDDLVIIIDAMVQGTKPGSIDIMLLSDAIKNRSRFKAQHAFTLFDMIELYSPRTRGYVIGVEASEIGFGIELSVALKKYFEQICTDVLRTVLHIKEQTGILDNEQHPTPIIPAKK